MTTLIATVTPSLGVLSQDTFFSPPAVDPPQGFSAATTRDHAQAARGTFVGDGTPPSIAAIGFGPKIGVFPHLHMAVGATGEYATLLQWWKFLSSTLANADIVEVDRVAPEELARALDAVSKSREFVCCHIGFSKHLNRIIGFAYNSTDNFASISMEGGHTMVPTVNAEHPGYDEIGDRWSDAAQGRDIEEFHVAVAKNQYQSYARGLLRGGTGIGRQLHSARIDETGIGVRVTHQFPGYESPRAPTP